MNMQTDNFSLLNDKLFRTGLGFLALSSVTFLVAINTDFPSRDFFTPFFFISYGLAVAFGIFILVKFGIKVLFKRDLIVPALPYLTVGVLLFNLSAYCLNKTIPVFETSVPWLCAFLVLQQIALVLSAFKKHQGRLLSELILLVLSIGIFFNLYEAVLISPMYAVGVMGSLFFGISLHVFVPLCLLIVTILNVYGYVAKGIWKSAVAAILIVLSASGIHICKWKKIDAIATRILHQSYKPWASPTISGWVALSQELPMDSFTEKYLKCGLTYRCFDRDLFFRFSLRNNINENTYHDPLVYIASIFSGKNASFPDRRQRLKILDYAYDLRHSTAERFWSGLNLSTNNIITNIQFFPEYRLAYTEKILTIANSQYNNRSRWFSQQEAIYTFNIPEGGAVTSLSLWIAGREEKARLTTPSNAEKAYEKIVGRERRDPSVVYWKEGNKILVRVFPCTPEENRRFKIGITSPLKYQDNRLIYENITFKGPDFSDAHASVNIVNSAAKKFAATVDFVKNDNGYSYEGDYAPDWQVSFEATDIARGAFTFNGNRYAVAPIRQELVSFDLETVYLDMDNQWTKEEISNILNLFPHKKLFINTYYPESISAKSTSEMIKKITKAEKPNYTLFPFYEIKDSINTLVITKGGAPTPNLADLEGTDFHQSLFASFAENKNKFNVFDIGSRPTPLMKSLNEFQVINYQQGTIEDLEKMVNSKKFPVFVSNDQCTPVVTAQMSVVMEASGAKTEAGENGNAPDQLLRLFAYNRIMREIGRNYFNKSYLNDSLIKIAQEANVVSPLSSLIVLETSADYKRFGINEQGRDALGNAAIQSSGAVPEPHEWLLILTGMGFIAFAVYRRKQRQAICSGLLTDFM
jgi:XrtN system VIT domain protein